MVSDELKPKVLLCMLGDKVSNLLVNLGEEELKDYESLKQVVLKEYEPSPKICLENFRKAKRNSDETFSQFASRLTSMWLYYCKLREANDFESVNQLIVADKMFEMLDSETATHIGVLQGEEWYKPRNLGKQCDIFYASKGKSYDEPERAKWNDSKRRSFNGSWDKHFKRNCPKNKGVDNKRLNVNKVSTEGTELEDGTVTARVDLLGKVIPRRAIEDKLSKLVKTSISVDGKFFGPAVKCPLVYVPIGLATSGQVNVVHQQVLCALAEVLVEDVLLPPDVLDMLGGAQSEENSLAQSSQDLRVDSGNVDETEVSLGILPEKAQEHIEDSQRNITSCRNEVGTLSTKDEEVTAEMDKGSMVADSFRSEQECCAELALAWKYAKEGKGNYYEVDGYLFRRDKILGESIGQLVIPKCRRTEVLRLAHTSVFSSHMGPKKTIERIKYSFFWEGQRADVKKFCELCKECQLTRSVRIKDRSPITPVARPELPFQVVNMDLIGPIDPPSSKGHKYILCLVDQHTRWGEAVPLTSLSAKVTCEALLSIFSRTGNRDLLKGYWQIKMDEESKPLTAFTTHNAVYQWKTMPFGLAGASGTFQREMNRILKSHSEYAQAYMDDVVIFSKTFEEHLVHLELVLTELEKLGFSVRLDKCSFAAKRIKYLGHTIGGGKHGPDEDKILAIKRLIRPTTKKEVRSVLGLMGFYRAYIPNYAEISTPLTELTKKNKPNDVSWGEAEQNSFVKLKELLCEVTSLATPDANLPFQVHCDTSDYGVGCCLTQQDTEGIYRPIAFASQKFNATQKNWASIKKEAWAVLYGLNKFDKWIYGAKVEIISDHNPLKYLNQTTPKKSQANRWALALQRWNHSITHRPGIQHRSADALSRLR
ncbi:retrovirus-related Pol polyprotein from transposon 17.6 [Trichonephila clavipes]|nr:retrovirus-related Pol polyprotein from transposon 17.6 [Trichonephila clavipes]